MTLYKPFLNYAIDLLKNSLVLESCSIPPELESRSAILGKGKRQNEISIKSYSYKASKFRHIRASYAKGTQGLEVLNFVMFPHLNYELPFFGVDLVTLPGGHLVALDLQPIFPNDSRYHEKYTQPILPISQTYQKHLPWGGYLPEEALSFFSPAFIWTRTQDQEIMETHVFNAFQDYLQIYLTLVNQATPITDPSSLKEIKKAHQRYINYRAQKDPARRMLTQFYGSEWAEDYIHGFLFNENFNADPPNIESD